MPLLKGVCSQRNKGAWNRGIKKKAERVTLSYRAAALYGHGRQEFFSASSLSLTPEMSMEGSSIMMPGALCSCCNSREQGQAWASRSG